MSVHILRNQLLPKSGPPTPLRNKDNQAPTRNICTETATFYMDNATKNFKKIIDFGPYKGKGVGYDY